MKPTVTEEFEALARMLAQANIDTRFLRPFVISRDECYAVVQETGSMSEVPPNGEIVEVMGVRCQVVGSREGQMNIHEKVLRWMASGRTGVSSKTMALTAVDIPVTDAFGHGYPRDPSDLDRCLGLLEAVPEVRLAFHKIAALSPTWKALIDRWDEIEETFIEEVGIERPRHASAERTYRLMREVIESSGT